MKRTFAFAFAACLVLAPLGPTLAQQPTASPQTPAPESPLPRRPPPTQEPTNDADDVVRITTNLVQFDAVVTDKQGRQVTDLKAEEFEILVNGKPQQITNFSYNSNESGVPATPKPAEKNPVAAPPVRLRPEQVRRTIAVVVDDQRMNWTSLHGVRHGLRKFVNEQIQPGDFVAILRTRGGAGFLQQFTSDKRLLLTAIENMRWNFGAGVEPFERVEAPEYESIAGAKESLDAFIRQRAQIGARGLTSVLGDVIRGLDDLPGRKSLVLVADGIYTPPHGEPGHDRDLWFGLNSVIEEANRSAVIIYTVDSRGVPNFGYSAADNLTGYGAGQISSIALGRARQYFDTRRGMVLLAEETGGLSFDHSLDLAANVRRVLEDQKGYYLVGYRPDENAFGADRLRPHFNKLTVRVKRKGLKVRTRAGFFGYTDRRRQPPPVTRAGQLHAALNSPFASGGVRLRLTALFGRDQKRGPFVRSILHIDGRDLSFTEEPDGWHRAVVDVVAVTQRADGQVLDEVNRTHTVRVNGRRHQQILEGGLVYSILVPVKKPGAYHLRTAVRDGATERVGSASQFVEVPDLKKGRLALSGILMTGHEASNVRETASDADDDGEGPSAAPDASATAAVRRFRQGALVDYAFNIHNAKLDPATGRPQLQTRLRLYREGRQVLDGAPQPFDAPPLSGQPDLGAGGRLRLAPELPPGEYVLQVIVTDLLAKEKQRTTTQWIDFDIVK